MDKSPRKTARALVSALICLIMAAGIPGCRFPAGHNAFTPQEQRIIRQSDSVMYVTVLPEDSAILRATVQDLPEALLRSEDFKTLAAKMLATVQSPEQDGVGIAAPQVGISRRLAWVQRYDKPGEPWELYPNIRILERSGTVSHDPEGCLSVPPQRAVVPRYETVIVSWTDPQTLHLYAYCANDPLNHVDPGGHKAVKNGDFYVENQFTFTWAIFLVCVFKSSYSWKVRNYKIKKCKRTKLKLEYHFPFEG